MLKFEENILITDEVTETNKIKRKQRRVREQSVAQCQLAKEDQQRAELSNHSDLEFEIWTNRCTSQINKAIV